MVTISNAYKRILLRVPRIEKTSTSRIRNSNLLIMVIVFFPLNTIISSSPNSKKHQHILIPVALTTSIRIFHTSCDIDSTGNNKTRSVSGL